MTPDSDDSPTVPAPPDATLTGRRIGPYRIVRELGHGGMGEVYLATRDDQEYRKDVAIKVVRRGLESDLVVRRFRHERQILASLEHPNIASLLDGGTTTEALPYFVMEYVEGTPIDVYSDTRRLSVRERLVLFQTVCSAVQHAHDHHVIHRDLKPTNILVSADGVPKLLDFGIAKLLTSAANGESATVTAAGMLTPEFASPEQIRGESVDEATDIYALGVVLYKLLTGQSPYRFTTGRLHELSRAICEDHPVPPSVAISTATRTAAAVRSRPSKPEQVSTRAESMDRLRRELSGDLDCIVLKALRKEPQQRYASVREFSDDIGRYLEGQPVIARKGTTTYRLRKFVRRHRAALVAVITIIILIGAVAALAFRGAPWGRPADVRTLAVLPFHALGNAGEDEYFGLGVTDALITQLSNLPQIAVRPTTAVQIYQSEPADVVTAGKKLQVEAVLDGRFQRDGERIRLTVQLINVSTGLPLWAETFDEQFTNLFALQDSVSRRVAQTLLRRLTKEEQGRLASGSPTDSRAYELYLKGRYQWNKRSEDGLKTAIQYFEQAAALDPEFGAAYSGIADAYMTLYDYGFLSSATATPKAREAAVKAVALNDRLAEAHSSLAHLALHDWQWADAEREFQRALELNPSAASTYHWYALYLTTVGKVDEAVRAIQKAYQLDPTSLRIKADVGQAFNAARRPDEAIEQERQVLEVNPNARVAYWIRGMAHEQKGEFEQAIRDFQEALKRSPDNPNYLGALGHAYAVSGRASEARKIAEKLGQPVSGEEMPAFFIALVYAGLGDKDRAFQWLEHAYRDRSGSVRYLKVEPRLDPLRSDRRFEDLMQRVGLR